MPMPAGESPQWLLFDLGGVLVEFSGVRDLAPLLRQPCSEHEIRARWMACRHVRAFEMGTVQPAHFAENFVCDWDIQLDAERFLREFRTWTRRLLPGARELLVDLRRRYRLAALSNSNVTHWERNLTELGIGDLFDETYSSHQLGLRKPDPAIYRLALRRLRADARQVLFFDDVAVNVEAAKRLGIRSFQVEGVAELRACLEKLGLVAL